MSSQLNPSQTTASFRAGRLSYNNELIRPNVTAATLTLDNTYSDVNVDATSASPTITLPAAASYKGKSYTITKVDSTANFVIVAPNGAEVINGATSKVLVNQWDQLNILSDGVQWAIIGVDPEASRLLSRTTVLLTAVADTTLFTVPTAKTLKVDKVVIEGNTVQSGGTSSKLLIGTSGASFAELLNGSTGHTFISGTATSLLAVGSSFRVQDRYPLATASVADITSFTAASIIKADVSGTVVTAGAVWVELWGRLI